MRNALAVVLVLSSQHSILTICPFLATRWLHERPNGSKNDPGIALIHKYIHRYTYLYVYICTHHMHTYKGPGEDRQHVELAALAVVLILARELLITQLRVRLWG